MYSAFLGGLGSLSRPFRHAYRERVAVGLEGTFALIRQSKKYKELIKRLNEGGELSVSVSPSMRAYTLASLYSSVKRPLLVITSSSERARNLVADLRAFSVEASGFPEVETMLYDSLSPSPASVGERFAVLNSMISGQDIIWVASIQAAMRVMPPVSEALYRPIRLKVGDSLDLYKLAADLVSMGYVRVPLVENQGQFSLRGGIIDIFSSSMQSPVRIELFGDDVDSIRIFGVSDQRSVVQVKEVEVYGCRQVALTQENKERAVAKLSYLLDPNSSGDESGFAEEIALLKEMHHFEGIEKYLPFLYGETSSLLDYLPQQSILVVDEPEQIEQSARLYFEQQQAYVDHLVAHRAIIEPPIPYFRHPDDVFNWSSAKMELISIGTASEDIVNFPGSPIQPMAGRVEQLKESIEDYLGLGVKVFISLHDDRQLERTVLI